jgi:UDP-N-acetylmuramoyl-L-alanyl-D-glutamate--2,6-diaminopimelate ligase
MEPTRSLSTLGLRPARGGDVAVCDIALDSRNVVRGGLFAALPGTQVHGAAFIPYAIRMGAAAILTDPAGAAMAADDLAAFGGAVVVVDDARLALAHALARFVDAQPETVVAVTGTSGKTSVASFTCQLWLALGLRAASLGTLGVEGDFAAPLKHTTPDPVTLHRLLADMAVAGITHLAMEASSHGLDQRRLDGVRIAAAGFTNLSQDHLDYHPDMESYFAAKAGLFDRLLPTGAGAAVCLDDPRGPKIAAMVRDRGGRVIGVGTGPDADLRIGAQRFDATGQTLRFTWAGGPRQTRLELVGGFQAANALLAAGLCILSGAAPDPVFDALCRLGTVPGRMERAATRANGAPVFVDYSHKPGALVAALTALRPHVMGRIVVVLGAGGDRDRGKRVLMGEAACAHADIVYVTDDNPRSEDPAAIRAAVLAGCPGASEVPDRAEAILRGVDALGPGDALLIAGKGHETGQIVGDAVYPFDDREQASIAVAALDGAGA